MGDPRGAIKAERRDAMKDKTEEKKSKGKKVYEKKVEKKKIEIMNTVRVAGTNLDGNKKVAIALMRIRGVGYNFARAVLHVAEMDYNKKLSDLNEGEIKKIEEIIEKPTQFNIPAWLLNRKNDLETGKDLHISGSELAMALRDDINLMRRIRSYKGMRHEFGLPVRGQRTRSSFRKGGKVGVIKKTELRRAASEKDKEKKK